jgi:hypothetical protein
MANFWDFSCVCVGLLFFIFRQHSLQWFTANPSPFTASYSLIDAIVQGDHVDTFGVDSGAKLGGNGPGAVPVPWTRSPVRHQRVVAVRCCAAETNRHDVLGT